MSMYEYLKNDQETIPRWLLEIKEGDKFSRDDFFSSRIVFYPGSYTDGHAVKVFGSTHAAHSFVYVDYWVTQEVLETELVQHAFLGYENLFSIQVSSNDLPLMVGHPRFILHPDIHLMLQIGGGKPIPSFKYWNVSRNTMRHMVQND